MRTPHLTLTAKVALMGGMLLLTMTGSYSYLIVRMGDTAAVLGEQGRLTQRQTDLLDRQRQLVERQVAESAQHTWLAERQFRDRDDRYR